MIYCTLIIIQIVVCDYIEFVQQIIQGSAKFGMQFIWNWWMYTKKNLARGSWDFDALNQSILTNESCYNTNKSRLLALQTPFKWGTKVPIHNYITLYATDTTKTICLFASEPVKRGTLGRKHRSLKNQNLRR